MSRLSWPARLYILAIVLSAAALWWGSLLASAWGELPGLAPGALVFLLATVAAELMAVSLPRGGAISVSAIPHVAAALIFPTPVAMATSALAMLVHQLYSRRPWLRAVYNTSSNALVVGVSASVLTLTGNQPGSALYADNWRGLAALVAVPATYYLLDNVLITLVVSLSAKRSLRSVFLGNSQFTLLPEMGMVMVGELLALLWVWRPLWSLAIVLPTLITHRTLQAVRRLQTETEEAVTALADIVDARDSYTFRHSSRVSAYARAIAEEIGLDAGEVDLIASAARVHDLGKLSIPDAVLLKSAPLTPAEWVTMRGHAAAGAEMLGRFQLYRAGMRLARHHHERFDGSGYPDGLAGESIPRGARIIAVADAYDAMTSDRPYRRGLPAREAVERVVAGRGTQFDPTAVDALVKLASRGELAELVRGLGQDHAEAAAEPDGARPDEKVVALAVAPGPSWLATPSSARQGSGAGG